MKNIQQPIHNLDTGGLNPLTLMDRLDGTYADLTNERELTYEQFCELRDAFTPADFEDDREAERADDADQHGHWDDWQG